MTDRPYDADMIQDFVTHLVRELRAIVQVKSSGDDNISPEVCEDLQDVIARRGNSLTPLYHLVTHESPPDQVARARELLAQAQVRRYSEAVDHLESLASIFGEAVSCIRFCRKARADVASVSVTPDEVIAKNGEL